MLVPLVLISLVLATTTPGLAIGPDELLDDAALEARARTISKQLRCVVCQNQSIDDSNAAIARDMRLVVRERLVAGDSDAQTIAYLVARYGDYVLLKPPFKALTLPLWLGPPVMILLVVGIVFLRTRRTLREQAVAKGAGSPTEPLTGDEQARLDRIVATRPTTPGEDTQR
ncbi:MAG: cytochrome c-type biogenesis protein CcmH [Alphaproteobacteria bacterium]|nr:cytochrome c-type biogenesis protein CcmH [Alphaproteobacteria bacterium]